MSDTYSGAAPDRSTAGGHIRHGRARHGVLALLVVSGLGGWAAAAMAQTPPVVKAYSRTLPGTLKSLPDPSYTRPTAQTKFRNYLFDAFGPYPLAGAALTAGISQAGNGVPEWGQGAEGFGKRMGSAFGIAAVSTTTRYALSAAFHEDGLYYRCDCTGALPRLKHAVVSTVTARRGTDGHRVFSLPGLVAPYTGAATAVYAWYPDRYSAKDAFRMGNYSLLAYVGGNIALEFLFRGPNSWLSRLRLNNGQAAQQPGSGR
ncbi:hypothetical protein [uncultured Paludibaculum sp.]|uniref:hypothetical protein n=1 Tax=uncultured Paludibaculum sp. TaxID=1765020 RepID=UPI002AABC2B6|nr:hypothetical protein [uncultured Paludibaculum sp.]